MEKTRFVITCIAPNKVQNILAWCLYYYSDTDYKILRLFGVEFGLERGCLHVLDCTCYDYD